MALGIIINGATGPIRQQIRVSYDPQHGQMITIPWKCAGNNLAGLAAFYRRNRVAFDWEPSDRISHLTARVAGGQLGIPDVTADEWQLVANEQQLSLLYMSSMNDDARSSITEELDKGTKPSDTPFSGDPILNGVYLRLYNGEANFSIGQQVLVHTTNTNETYQGNVADYNIERIYTTAQLFAEVQNSNFWIFPMPGGLRSAIETMEANFIAMFPGRIGYRIGWRKLPSTRTTAAGNRIAIKTEYWYGQHDSFIYLDATFS